ncbi:MAG: hypothetical protein GX638_09840 [Crenarchaeota archaeon]|nr:hypothetical protein [Thermoproteota archaeon]
MKKIIKKVNWCPHPQKNIGKPFHTSLFRFSPRILAFIVVAELLLLLIAPMTYYALLAPNSLISEQREIKLTDSQIMKAWPNLPSGDQIKNCNVPYFNFSSTLAPLTIVQNRTRINMLANFGLVKIPIAYCIYVQDSNGSWIKVPQEYLNTDNPPEIQSAGFMGTDLSNDYVILAFITIIITIMIGTNYIIFHKKT